MTTTDKSIFSNKKTDFLFGILNYIVLLIAEKMNDPHFARKTSVFEDQERSVSNNRIFFDREWNELHEGGAALPKVFVFGLVRAYFFGFEGSSLAQTSGTGSFAFSADGHAWSRKNSLIQHIKKGRPWCGSPFLFFIDCGV